MVRPAVGVACDILPFICDATWPELEEQTGGRTAPWASIQPQNEWGILRRSASLEKPEFHERCDYDT